MQADGDIVVDTRLVAHFAHRAYYLSTWYLEQVLLDLDLNWATASQSLVARARARAFEDALFRRYVQGKEGPDLLS